MEVTFDLLTARVWDDCLDPKEFDELYTWFNRLEWWRHSSGRPQDPAWSTTDGDPLIAKPVKFTIDELISLPETVEPVLVPLLKVLAAGLSFFNRDLVDHIEIVPFAYPPGSGLGWHTDKHALGALTFYTHYDWSSSWGGELLLAPGVKLDAQDEEYYHRFDHNSIDDKIEKHGRGHWISPRPNRMVALKTPVLHKINRTTPQAQDRLSLQVWVYAKLTRQELQQINKATNVFAQVDAGQLPVELQQQIAQIQQGIALNDQDL
jgi:hypothetical protein